MSDTMQEGLVYEVGIVGDRTPPREFTNYDEAVAAMRSIFVDAGVAGGWTREMGEKGWAHELRYALENLASQTGWRPGGVVDEGEGVWFAMHCQPEGAEDKGVALTVRRAGR